MDYDCEISGDLLICRITSDRDLPTPIFCFSGMAPHEPVTGGTLVKAVGSYTEISLPDLQAGNVHTIKIGYSGGFTPANRAWMPLGPHLRIGKNLIPLPPTAAGRRAQPIEKHGAFSGLPIVPQPEIWQPSGTRMAIDGFASDDDALSAVAALATRQGMVFKGQHPVTMQTGDLGVDAYTIDITSDGVTITANSYGGRFYAGITLLTLLQQGPLPCGRISDAPRFGWRGQHLDTARHYYEPQTILALLDLMALLKLNRFHWHFADDEAFRLEIDSHPELWQRSAMRGEGHTLPGIFAGEIEQGGSYSKDTASGIIAHARALNIEIMPEIEAPAHALAITKIYPETRDPGDNGQECSVQGYRGNALNPAMPKTWELLNDIAKEVGEVFPFEMLHLGCDELPEDTWMGSPKARALMATEGLETTKDLQGWTIARLAQSVVQNGKRPAAWEEAAQGSQGGIGNGAVLFSWTGQGPGLDAARAGYDVVMTPAQHVYLDMAHSDDPDDWGASWAGFVSLEDTINWDPVPDQTLTDRIIGVQGTFWSEFTTRDTELWPMLMPRLLGVSAKAWQSTDMTPSQLVTLAGYYQTDDRGIIRISPP